MNKGVQTLHCKSFQVLKQSPNSIVARMDRSIQAGRESWKEKIRPSLSCTDPNMSSSFSGPDLKLRLQKS